MARAMRASLADAQLDPSDVDYINAHATATNVGDVAESVADDVPESVRPFAGYLASKSETLHASVDALSGSADLRAYHELFFDQLGDSDDWPGIRAFVAAAGESPDCHLDPSR